MVYYKSDIVKRLGSMVMRIMFKGLVVCIIILGTTYGWAEAPSTAKEGLNMNLEETVTHLSRTIGVRNAQHDDNLNRAAEYITERFVRLGYQVDFQPYTVNGQTFRNIIAERPEVPPQGPILVVGAHYDSCFNPGADDNASGIAGVLELARLLRHAPLKARIRFIAFTNEEPPFFMTDAMGSMVYARRSRDLREPVKAALILEMIGYYTEARHSQRYPSLLGPFYPNKGRFLAVVGNWASRRVTRDVVTAMKSGSRLPVESITAPAFVPGINFSDHGAFWKYGFPAVMVTDTAYLRNPHYHKPSDLPETLNYEKMAEAVLGLESAVRRLAGEAPR